MKVLYNLSFLFFSGGRLGKCVICSMSDGAVYFIILVKGGRIRDYRERPRENSYTRDHAWP